MSLVFEKGIKRGIPRVVPRYTPTTGVCLSIITQNKNFDANNFPWVGLGPNYNTPLTWIDL